jgi:arginyl-tRNA synthetase
VGDWGTQFGMLIGELDISFPNWLNEKIEIADLQTFYQNSKKRFDADKEFQETAKANVVKLQSGEEHQRKAWELLCEVSRVEYFKIYERLDI